MSDSFYRAFEDRYRGSRDLIKGRLAVYLPFVEPFLKAPEPVRAVDLGCGRGEWLEILSDWGVQPVGVDLNAGMLASCHDLGLKVEQCDAIGYLRALPSDSRAIVSAFHLVEHLPFDDLRVLVSEAMRVLQPGGLLIMETPNPENLVVATRNFYLDPTHQRPIPSQLLAFVAEHAGFRRVKTLGLQEPKDLAAKAAITLSDVFHGASPDYAIIAQKLADSDVLVLFEEPFSRDYGLSQDDLLGRWDMQLKSQIEQIERKALQAENNALQAEAKAQQAEDSARQAWAQLAAVYASSSWRITRPLRAAKRIVSGDFSPIERCATRLRSTLARIPGLLKVYRLVKDPVRHGIRFVASRPRLRGWLVSIVKRVPGLRDWLRARREAQLRADFSEIWSRHGLGSSGLQPSGTDFAFKERMRTGQRSVDEILERIRAELSLVKGNK